MPYITKLPFEGTFKITYPYGVLDRNYASGRHDGIDMGNSINPNVYSIVNGRVSYAGWENINNKKQGFGLYVSIKFDVNSSGFKKVFLSHLNEIKVSVNQDVNPATIIGIMGSTGFSTGPHTHVEIREYNSNGVLIKKLNPANFMGVPNVVGTYDSANYRINLDNKPKTQTVTLPASVQSWRVYPLNKAPVVGNECGKLFPSKFGGLTYNILSWNVANVAIIKTRDFGEIQIYVGPDTEAIIK